MNEIEYPTCPICGRTCANIYKNMFYEIVGCDRCIHLYDAWEIDECFRTEE